MMPNRAWHRSLFKARKFEDVRRGHHHGGAVPESIPQSSQPWQCSLWAWGESQNWLPINVFHSYVPLLAIFVCQIITLFFDKNQIKKFPSWNYRALHVLFLFIFELPAKVEETLIYALVSEPGIPKMSFCCAKDEDLSVCFTNSHNFNAYFFLIQKLTFLDLLWFIQVFLGAMGHGVGVVLKMLCWFLQVSMFMLVWEKHAFNV